MTHTRAHVVIDFANPYLACDQCKRQVTDYHDPQRCGCGGDNTDHNVPCEHPVGATSVCPSWSPVDGCCCLAHLGYVPHGPAGGSS